MVEFLGSAGLGDGQSTRGGMGVGLAKRAIDRLELEAIAVAVNTNEESPATRPETWSRALVGTVHPNATPGFKSASHTHQWSLWSPKRKAWSLPQPQES